MLAKQNLEIKEDNKMNKENKKQLTLKEFTNAVSSNFEFKIDYKTHAHLQNNVGLAPIMSYEMGARLVKFMIYYANKLGSNRYYDVNFYIEELRISTLKMFALELVDDINNNK